VDFVLQPAFVFQAGLQLVSLPDDYTNPLQDPKAVFGNPPGFKMAKFVPNINNYVLYPHPSPDPSRPGYGADRLQSGYGEFVRFTQTTAFTTPGTPNTGPTVEVPIESGWTIIGNPYSAALGFSQLGVRRSDGTVLTMQQALNAGVMFNDLLGWTGSGYTHHEQFLQPFKGYFVFAFEPVTLIMPNPATIAAVPGNVRYAEVSPAVRRLVEAVLPRMNGAAPGGARLAGPVVPPFRSIVSGAAPWDGGFFAAIAQEQPRFAPALTFRKERKRTA